MSARLDKFTIHAWRDEFSTWHASLREYDIGVKVSTGGTQREAIDELLDNYERDNGELHE